EAWLRGNGCVPINNLMEDAATAEICRSQLWQWRKHGASITDGPPIDDDLLARLIAEEAERIAGARGEDAEALAALEEARALFWDMTASDEFQEFLTLPAYQRISADAA
ncbi:MAG: malate synthase A, partial [Rhodospirillaceae bacterium]|nr:malate synthase A [Rhodospirillaceae bacterium]